MRAVRLLAVLLVFAPAIGCGDSGGGTGRLVVVEPPRTEPHYMEGSIRFLRVTADGGERVLAPGPVDRSHEPREHVIFDRSVPATRYEVVRHERPCQGNCDYLDPPAGRCETVAEVEDGRTLTVTVVNHPDGSCTMRVS